MEVSPPIPVRIEWADSQGNVTASWLAAHFEFSGFFPIKIVDGAWHFSVCRGDAASRVSTIRLKNMTAS